MAMKLYLFTKITDIDYGECIGAVIAASTEKIAKQLMSDHLREETDDNWKCDLIDETKQGMILDSWSNE